MGNAIQNAHTTIAAGGSSGTVSFTNPVGTGSVVVVTANGDNFAAIAPITVSDGTNSFTQRVGQTMTDGFGSMALFDFTYASGGSPTITVTLHSASNAMKFDISAVELPACTYRSGSATSGAADFSGLVASGTLTNSASGDYCVMTVLANGASGTDPAIVGTFGTNAATLYTGDATQSQGMQDGTASGSSIVASMTAGTSGFGYVFVAAAYQPATGGAIIGTSAATAGQSGTLAGSGLLSGTASAVAGGFAMPFFQLYGSAGQFDYSVAGPAAWFDVDTFTNSTPGPAAGWYDTDYLYPSSATPGALAGSSAASAGQAGALTGAGSLTGASAATAGQSGAINGAGALAGSSAATAGQAGALTGSGALAGTSAASGGQSGLLAAVGALVGAAAAVAGQVATLLGAGALSGTSQATAGQSGTLTQPGLSGASAATAGQAGTLTGTGALAGTSPAMAGQSGALTQPGLNGASAAVAGQSGALAGKGALTGASAATAGQAGALGGTGAVAGTSAAIAGQSGSLKGAGALGGMTAASAGQAGLLSAIGSLFGAAGAVAGAIGNIVNASLQGIANAIAGQSGTIISSTQQVPPNFALYVLDSSAAYTNGVGWSYTFPEWANELRSGDSLLIETAFVPQPALDLLVGDDSPIPGNVPLFLIVTGLRAEAS